MTFLAVATLAFATAVQPPLLPALAGVFAGPAVQGPVLSAPSGTRETRSAPSDYAIGAGDVLEVTVFDHEDLSGKFTVGSDGTFQFPLLGSVAASGRTAEQLVASMREALAAGFLRQPQVTVRVSEFVSRRVFVIGEVRNPGPIPLSSGLTLIEALALAGSVTDTAGVEISIARPAPNSGQRGPLVGGQPGIRETLKVNLADLQRGASGANIPLSDGDTVFVPKGGEVYVLGQVKNPGPLVFRQNLTVLQALSLAGGVTDLGASGRVRILRIVGTEKKELKAKLSDVVQPGDTLMVPTRWF